MKHYLLIFVFLCVCWDVCPLIYGPSCPLFVVVLLHESSSDEFSSLGFMLRGKSTTVAGVAVCVR